MSTAPLHPAICRRAATHVATCWKQNLHRLRPETRRKLQDPTAAQACVAFAYARDRCTLDVVLRNEQAASA